MAPHHPRLGVRVPGGMDASGTGRTRDRGGRDDPGPCRGPDPAQLEERPPELVVALLPSLVRTMLTAFVEVMAEQRASKA